MEDREHSIKAYLISPISLNSDFSFNSQERENPTSHTYCFKNSHKTLQDFLERSSGGHHMKIWKETEVGKHPTLDCSCLM